jgi:hypothetical protein
LTVVHNTLRHGLELRLYEHNDKGHGAFSFNADAMTAKRLGDPVVLRPGRNEVDDEFWAAWCEQYKGCGFLESHAIYEETKPEVRP